VPSRIRVFLSRCLGWLRNSALDEEFDAELQTHLALMTEENLRQGMRPEDAKRAARVRLGGVTQLRENQRDRRGFVLPGAFMQDLRYAVRVFRRSPGFTAVAVLTIAIGVGVNAVVFTLLNAVALKPLPVADAANLVRLQRSFQSGARGDVQYAFSFDEYMHYRQHSQRFSSIVAAGWPEPVVVNGHTLHGQIVSENYFAALGVSPALGRAFLAEENLAPGAAPVIVLADAFWRRQFQADPQAVGRSIALNGTAFTVIGVASPTFIGTGNPPQVPDFWTPLMMQSALSPGSAWLDNPQVRRLQLFARIKTDARIETARAELEGLTSQLAEVAETSAQQDRTIAVTLQPAVYFGGTDDVRFAGFAALVMAIVSMILLVACANLANMLFARGAARHTEIAVRLALGASRGRIVRQLLTESLLLASLGGVVGLLTSLWGSQLLWTLVDRLMRMIYLTDRPFVASVALDGRIFAFTFALSVATGLLFGTAPALKVSGSALTAAMKDDHLFPSALRPSRAWLVAGQTAVSMAFLISAGLLLRGLMRAHETDVGFDASRVFMVFMSDGTDAREAAASQRRIVNRLALAPELQGVALVDRFPFAGTWSPPVIPGDRDTRQGARATRTLANYVSANYFRTMGIPILAGRPFTAADERERSPSVIVSESAARRLWPDENPLGKRLTLDMTFRGDLASFEVVGVAKDVRSANVSRLDPGYVYLPVRSADVYHLVIRSDRDPSIVSAAVTSAVEAVDRRLLPTVRVMRMSDGPFLRAQMTVQEIAGPFAAGLAAMALMLAGIGIYGVTAYFASRRTREIGVRMALGATAGDVQWLMFRQAMTPGMIGSGVGVIVAAALSRLLQASLSVPSTPDLLFGISSFDPITFVGASLFALVVAILAAYVPARRATRVDPLVALRYE
jgi:predicted permease